MIATFTSERIADASTIPFVTADEAYSLLQTELDRLLKLLDTLTPVDWERPTACTLWNVRDIVAHQAGAYVTGLGYQEFVRLMLKSKPSRGELPEDAANRFQLSERAGRTPAELIGELRRVGPTAISKWAYKFRLLKLLTKPHPVAGSISGRYFLWVIHSRDTWMHRLDICRATGRQFEQTAAHDGRIAALVVRDVEKRLRGKLERAVVFDLSGTAGGVWKIGPGEAKATVNMDMLDFNIFASGRFTYSEARSRAQFTGDIALAEKAMQNILVLY